MFITSRVDNFIRQRIIKRIEEDGIWINSIHLTMLIPRIEVYASWPLKSCFYKTKPKGLYRNNIFHNKNMTYNFSIVHNTDEQIQIEVSYLWSLVLKRVTSLSASEQNLLDLTRNLEIDWITSKKQSASHIW
jgi:hypothetical protein